MEFQRSQKLKENFETNVISDSVRRLRCSSEPRIIDSLRQCARGVATTSSSSLNIKKKISNCAETDSESCMSTKIQGSNFKVAVRVRPPLLRELRSEWPYSNVIQVDQSEHFISVNENSIGNDPDTKQPDCGMFGSHVFSFDKIYDENSDQSKVYDETGKDLVMSCLSGYNATILAYGQTGAGKTYTMEGFGTEWEGRGIIPRAIEQVFTHIEENASPYLKFMVRGSYLQIYNDVITDLLRSDKECLAIRESSKRGIYVQGLSEWVVRNPQEIYSLMERGARLRSTATTKLNKVSSRSHAIFTIIVEQTAVYYVDSKGVEFGGARGGLEEEDLFQVGSERLDESVNSAQMNSRRLRNDYQISRQTFKVGKLNLVDLAGSERVRVSGASGQRLEESRKINQSLSALGNVIGALTDSKGRQHIPYRDSKLTRILEDSLGGNCKTTMIALVSPAQESMAETLSTLKFASRAKNIRNEAMVNEDLDQKSLLRKYERELHKLRSELEERSRTVVDSRQVLRLQQERDYALKDRLKAVRELERQSQVFRKEKEEKNRLEHRIASLTSQVIRGTSATSFTGRSENQNSHSKKNTFEEKLRKEYEARIAELEKEKGTFLFEKQQADRYKQQLIKMRDIMIALTHRLTQRDEQILGLQDELDEYESKEVNPVIS